MPQAEPLKHRIHREGIESLARFFTAASPRFASKRFVQRALDGLEPLELKARISHVAGALAATLPTDFEAAAPVIDTAVRLHRGAGPAAAVDVTDATFVFWPLCTFVEDHGLEHPDRALDTMHGLTALATCEFAIRPYIERDPQRVFKRLRRWANDDDMHVRRLVSEGTRPRLPWGRRLRALQGDPAPAVALLDALRQDPELYVRRSVANHLNDIAKDHPELAVTIATRWKEATPSDEVAWVVRHALRSLIKQGHRGALALEGVREPKLGELTFSVSPRRLRFGSSLSLELELQSTRAQELIIDYAVHHMKANGTRAPKVFKWVRRTVAKGETVALNKAHPIRAISTRRYYPGVHRVELLVNGRSLETRDFTLVGIPKA